MNIYAVCPCCSDKLIHHIGHHRDYWFCRACWQEMPVINSGVVTQKTNQMNHYEKSSVDFFSNMKSIKQVRFSAT